MGFLRGVGLALLLAMAVAVPAGAQTVPQTAPQTAPQIAPQPVPGAALPATAGPGAGDDMPVWERTLYKTLTYQAAANLSDLALYDVVLGGTAMAGAGFFALNAASAAGLYYAFEMAWETVGPAADAGGQESLVQKTFFYRVLNSSRNFALGYAFSASPTIAAGFVAANMVTDTMIFVGNEYAWDLFRPVRMTP